MTWLYNHIFLITIMSSEGTKEKYTATTKSIMDKLRQCDESIVEELKPVLFNDKPEKLAKWHALFKDPIFYPKQDLTLD